MADTNEPSKSPVCHVNLPHRAFHHAFAVSHSHCQFRCRYFVYLLACLDACLFVYSFVCLVCLVCLFVCLFFAFTQTTQTPVPTSCSFDTEHCTGLHYSNVFGRTVRRVSKQMRSMDLPDERSGRRTVLDREGNPLVVSAVVIYQV